MTQLQVVSVNVARPTVLLESERATVVSAIDKKPVESSSLWLTELNLEGDEQADGRLTPAGQPVHGGAHQAVYAYPSEHFPRLAEVLGQDVGPGYMGENLTIAGAVERDVFIGDTWAWGGARLEVSAPRSPCFKLGIRMEKQSLRTIVREEGLVGWYLRVLQPGAVPTRGTIEVVGRDGQAVSVSRVHRALQQRRETFPELAAHPALTPNLRMALTHKGRDLSGGVPERD